MPQGCDKGPSAIPSVTTLEKWRNPTVHVVGHSGCQVSRECFKRDLGKGEGSALPGDKIYPQGQAGPMHEPLGSDTCLPNWTPRRTGLVGGDQGPALEAVPGLPDHSWPEEGLESYISGEAKAPSQAEKRMAQREISSFDSTVFEAISVWAPVPEAPSPARACQLYTMEAQ